jgi:hypothetical protein
MPSNSSNVNGRTISILVGIFIVVIGAVSAMSLTGDAKLDDEKLDKEVYETQQTADEKIQIMRDKKLDGIVDKLDELLKK